MNLIQFTTVQIICLYDYKYIDGTQLFLHWTPSLSMISLLSNHIYLERVLAIPNSNVVEELTHQLNNS